MLDHARVSKSPSDAETSAKKPDTKQETGKGNDVTDASGIEEQMTQVKSSTTEG